MRHPSHSHRQAVLARAEFRIRGKMNILPDMACAPFHAPAELRISLVMPPSTNNLFINIGRKRARSPEYAAWLKHAGYLLNLQRPAPIKVRVDILIEVSEAECPDSADVANREKATIDLLVSHKIIQGDNKPYVRQVTMRWADCEGVRVTIRGVE